MATIKKRGIFFSLDALLALLLIFVIIFLAYPLIKAERQESELPRDVISVLSTLTMAELNTPEIQSLIASGEITNPDGSVLQQLGELAITNPTAAKSIAYDLLQTIDTTENIGIWYDGLLLASKNTTSFENATYVDVARQLISGISGNSSNTSVTGVSARSFLSSNELQKYTYFGGYVGDGNLSARIEYDGNITSATLEIALSDDAEILINDNSLGIYNASPDEFTPVSYDLPIDDFVGGAVNTIEFKGDNLHIAGGFLRVDYDADVVYELPKRYYFPGVQGLINVYDGIYIPDAIEELTISLHINSTEFDAFLNIGDTTVFSGKTNDEETIIIDNATLSSLLDYDSLIQETIPIRLGLVNATFVLNETISVDVITASETSRYLQCTIATPDSCLNNQGNCESCGGVWQGPFEESKDAHKALINILLEPSAYNDNQIGLRAFHSATYNAGYHALSDDNQSLINQVDDWDTSAGAWTCRAITDARDELIANTSDESDDYIVVMGVGEATKGCNELPSVGDLNFNGDVDDFGDQAIYAACDAYQNYNITTYAVAFGNFSDIATMQEIAACGNGVFYFSTIDDIIEVFEQVAEDILNATFFEQTILLEGTPKYTELFGDSYIEFETAQPTLPFGLVLTLENQFTTNEIGSFTIPSDAEVVETTAISYSGPRWTQRVFIDNTPIYDIDDYSSQYILIGDPYAVNIPNTDVQNGSTHVINITTSTGPGANFSGSEYNKIVYTILKEANSFSPILGSANGCAWTIQFEDLSNVSVTVPGNYSGSSTCTYNLASPAGSIADNDDALQVAVLNLLREIDFDSNGLADVSFSSQDLQIDTTQITGIPFAWSTEVQVRVWG